MRRRVATNRVAALSIAIFVALVALTISGVIAATASTSETRSLTSSADTQIVENAPTKNYGDVTSLGVNENDQSSVGKDKFSLVKWDLSGIAPRTQINSASVALNVTNASPQTYQAYVLKEPWIESTATWTVSSSGKPWEVAGAKGSLDKEATVSGSITPSVKGKNTFTLPLAVVQGWVDNPATNQGIIISNPSSTRGFNFNSREDADPTQRPQLILDLSPDTAPPETTLDSGPSGTVRTSSADFSFSASEAGSTIECSLDGSAFESCTSPKEYTDLSEGSHTFSVKATDQASNTDPTPASRTWTVDTTAPETTIVIGSADRATLSSGDASFTFSSSEAGSTLECSLDSAAYTSCTSPKEYTDLSEGSHTFQVKATDAAGNTDATPATQTFTVDTTAPAAPTISSGPADASTDTDGDFSYAFTGAEAGGTYQCSLDTGTASYSSCTSPKSYTGQANGSYTFRVRQVDAEGNVGSAVTRSFSVALPVQPYPGVRWYPVMGVYKGASAFASETGLIDSQYADYVGAANEKSYLDLGDNDAERYWFCGGRKYRMADFYVDGTDAPDTRAQAQDPNWQNYKWNLTDHLDAMLDNSTQVQAGKAKACLFVAFSATSNDGSVPQWMINDPNGLIWNGSGGQHVRMDKTEALQDVTDFYVALLKHYGNDERIGQLVVGEYYPGTGNPLTNAETDTFRANMKTFWTNIIAAAPRDANGDRMAILQSNPITTGGIVTAADIRSIGIGVTGSDPEMFDEPTDGQSTDNLQKKLRGDVPLQHQANANRLVNGYKITWDGTPNPWGFAQGTTNAIRYEYMAWYHGTQGPTPYDSMLMRDNSTLNAQWHEAYSQFGPNGSRASVWGQVPNYP